jgi:phosphate transport system permease protein
MKTNEKIMDIERKRSFIERISSGWMLFSLIFVLLLPLVIGLGLILKSLPVLQDQSLFSMFVRSDWFPMRGQFGFLPFIISSVYVTILSFILSAPICLMAAIYLTQYARQWLLKIMQPVIDILAGIPSVIYGVWGILVIVPIVSVIAERIFGEHTSGYCLLSGAIVLAVMSIPFILSILIEVFNTIPIELKEASLSIGATEWETIKYVLVRKGFSGIIASFGLGISKSLGETIAVLMVVGNVAKIPNSMFDPGYPIPALIANNYGEMMSIPLYDSALMLAALILFVIILLFNIISRLAINRGEAKV